MKEHLPHEDGKILVKILLGIGGAIVLELCLLSIDVVTYLLSKGGK
jgi:hypothetical protein